MTYPRTPGYKERDTARAAARAIQPRARTLRDRAFDCVCNRPRTPDEVAAFLRENILAVRPRMSELSKMGRIRKSGKKRFNASGIKAHVWEVALDSH